MTTLYLLSVTSDVVVSDNVQDEYEVKRYAYMSAREKHTLIIKSTIFSSGEEERFMAIGLVDGWEVFRCNSEDEMGRVLKENNWRIGIKDDKAGWVLTEKGRAYLSSIPYLFHEKPLFEETTKWS